MYSFSLEEMYESHKEIPSGMEHNHCSELTEMGDDWAGLKSHNKPLIGHKSML